GDAVIIPCFIINLTVSLTAVRAGRWGRWFISRFTHARLIATTLEALNLINGLLKAMEPKLSVILTIFIFNFLFWDTALHCFTPPKNGRGSFMMNLKWIKKKSLIRIKIV